VVLLFVLKLTTKRHPNTLTAFVSQRAWLAKNSM